VFQWHARFKTGRTSVDDDVMGGKWKNFDHGDCFKKYSFVVGLKCSSTRHTA
jgi:hypothetical protein